MIERRMPISDYLRELRAKVGSAYILTPCVTGLVFDESHRLLMVRHAHENGWGVLGGAIEPDETPEDAVVREVWEETSLQVEPTRLRAVLGGPQFRVTYPNGDQVGYIAAVFDCRPIGGTIRPDGIEVVEARFFEQSELVSLALSPYATSLGKIITTTEIAPLAHVTWHPPDA